MSEEAKKAVILKAADLINRTGLATETYHDRHTGCYCAVGAIRMVMFGTTSTSVADQSGKYIELIPWFARKIGVAWTQGISAETAIIKWNDDSDKETVVNKMREVGAS